MNLEEKYTLIEKYLAHEMDSDEVKKFEAQLQTNRELREELILHRQVAETLRGEKVHELRKVLKKIDQDWEAPSHQQEAKVVGFSFRKILSIAAVVLLLVVSGYFLFSNKNLSTQELYANNFEPYVMLLNQRSMDEAVTNVEDYNNAISFYNNQKHEEALIAFDQLLANQPNNITYQFYKANILLASQKGSAAIPVFEKIINGNNPLLEEQARWYLALAHLQNGDGENTKAVLGEVKEGEFKYEEATGILKQL